MPQGSMKIIFIYIMFLSMLSLIILFIYRLNKKNKYYKCKKCNKTVTDQDKICKNCGMIMDEDSKEIIIKKTDKKITAGLFASLGIFIVSLIVNICLYSQNGDILYDLSGSTGIYSYKKDNTLSNSDYWFVECKALTNGLFKKSVKNNGIEELIIDAKSSEGILELSILGENKVEKYDISNTKGELIIDVGDISEDTIRLAVKHDKSEKISIKIKWV